VTGTLLKRRAVVAAIVAVVAVVIVVIAVAAGGSDGPAASPSSSPSPTLVQGPAGSAPSVAGSIVTIAGNIVTIVGTVERVDPNGDFAINDGHVDYTIAMSTKVKIADLAGADLSPHAIQVNTSIQVTGALAGSTITAESVVVPASAPTPPTTS
jgi:uncharacterized protein YdeI (BOF family)